MRKAKREPEASTPLAAKTPTNQEFLDLEAVALAAKVERGRKWFEEVVKLLEKGERTKETLSAAFGIWIGYPQLLAGIGHNVKIVGPMPPHYTLERPESSWAAYHALNLAHTLATRFLMAQAEKCGLDPHPLYECGNLIQELYAHEPWRYYAGRFDTWPVCMGTARYSLPTGQQEALRAGEAVFIRLAVKLGVAEGEDMAQVSAKVKPVLPQSDEPRSDPMTLEELCRRYMNKKNVRAEKIKPILERLGLRRVHPRKNLWTVRLDLLEKAPRERMTQKDQS
jgi:hypothetical protein